MALLRASKSLGKLEAETEEQQAGVSIILRAVQEPLRQIVANAGGEPSVVVNEVLAGKQTYGYNARSQEYGDLVKMGVIDPTKVVRTALQNAASVASMMLTTEAMIAEKPKKEAPAPAAPDMGGMGM